MKTAFHSIQGSVDWVITADADGQHTLADIKKLIRAAEISQADLIW